MTRRHADLQCLIRPRDAEPLRLDALAAEMLRMADLLAASPAPSRFGFHLFEGPSEGEKSKMKLSTYFFFESDERSIPINFPADSLALAIHPRDSSRLPDGACKAMVRLLLLDAFARIEAFLPSSGIPAFSALVFELDSVANRAFSLLSNEETAGILASQNSGQPLFACGPTAADVARHWRMPWLAAHIERSGIEAGLAQPSLSASGTQATRKPRKPSL